MFLHKGKSIISYNDETLSAARQHISDMDANFGGTNILDPLQEACKLNTKQKRRVFLLTDG
jgi:hypothetical protein